MRFRHLLFLLGLLVGSFSVKALDASISFARFLTPSGAYLELHTHIAGGTISWLPVPGADSLQQAKLDFTVIFRQGDQVAIADRFTLASPAFVSGADFVDLRRYALTAGETYQLELSITDLADTTNNERYSTTVTLDNWPLKTAQSDIALLAGITESTEESNPFYRHGLLMEPLPHAFYGRGANVLAFYTEIYATDSLVGDRVLLLSKIERISNGVNKPVLAMNKVSKQAPLIPHVQQMDISKLTSGRYLLAVEVRSEQNELICRRELPFYRSNPLVDEEERESLLAVTDLTKTFLGGMDFDSLRYSLLALLPLLPQKDVVLINEIVRKKNEKALRSYLYAFWTRESPFDPEIGYRDFMAVADFVDKQFYSGFRNGFESDRGYVYIKYGPPSDITRVENDPSAPPYEIWSYNAIKRTKQNNCRFIFYNPTLAAGNFELIHSDVFGEVNNPQWEVKLYQDATGDAPSSPIDGTRMNDNMGRNARRFVDDF